MKNKDLIQMSLWQLYDMFDSGSIAPAPIADADDTLSDTLSDEEYLRKGDKILTLLRSKKKTQKPAKSFLDMFSMTTYLKKSVYGKHDYLLSQIAKKVIEPLCESVLTEDEGMVSTLEEFFSIGKLKTLHFSQLRDYEYGFRLMKAMFSKNPDSVHRVYRVTACSEDIVDITLAIGERAYLRKNQNGQRYRLSYGSNGSIRVSDVRYRLYATVWLTKVIRAEIQKRLGNADDRIVSFVQERLHECLEKALGRSEYGMLSLDKKVEQSGFILGYLKENQIPYCIVENDNAFYEERLLFYLMFLLAPEEALADSDSYFAIDSDRFLYFQIAFINALFDVHKQEKEEEEWAKKIASDYATSYQTKKNISGKMLKAMKNSSFNEWFGYVEFDNECDIAKLHEIEKEFHALAKVLKLANHPEVSLRFRKLGHHHASGLYYPFLKCLCVDVRTPSSMAHECFHMLDYESGHLSAGAGFHNIVRMYEKRLTQKMDEDEGLKKRLTSKSKYNKDYYLSPTEVFARSGELYLTRILKVDNSLAQPEEGFAYPDDGEYLSEIKVYFDTFFNGKEE